MSKGIVSTIVGGVEIAAGAVLTATGVGAPFGAALIVAGAGSLMTGIAQMLDKQPGQGISATNPIGAYNYIYGTMKVPGVEIFSETNSITQTGAHTSNDKQWHRVFALACHPTADLLEVRLDGQVLNLVPQSSSVAHTKIWQSASPTQTVRNISSISRSSGIATVVFSGGGFPSTFNGQTMLISGVSDNTYNGVWTMWLPNPAVLTTWEFVCGGANGSSSGGNCRTTLPDYSNKVHIEFQDGNQTQTFPGLLKAQVGSTSPLTWNTTDVCYGHTLVYVQLGYDSSYFPNYMPTLSFVVKGKNDILDPRTSTHGYTENPALCIADYMTVPRLRGGFGLSIGSTIDSSNLIAAANVCDETLTLAVGGTVPQYSCNTTFDLNSPRGTTIDRMLSSCAGRLSVQGGVWSVVPGAWVAPSLYLSEKNIVGPIRMTTRISVNEACNAVKGTYVNPANNYQPSDYPLYQLDTNHGYVANTWLVEDNNEILVHNLDLPCTNVSAVAQRLAKIQLMRQRYQFRLNLECDLTAYQATVTDVIALSIARYGFVNEPFEVLRSELIYDDNGAPKVALDLAQVDVAGSAGSSAIYQWTPSEELAITNSIVPNNVGMRIAVAPNNVVAYSGFGGVIGGITYPSTVSKGADARVQNAIYVRWDVPNDANVVLGGHMEVQYQKSGDAAWTGFTKVDPSVNYLFISHVDDNQTYVVQVRAVNSAGVPSEWVPSTLTVANVISDAFAGSPVAHVPGHVGSLYGLLLSYAYSSTAEIGVANFDATIGPTTVSVTPVTPITGLNQSELYYVYYSDPTFSGGTVTPIATQDPSDYLGVPGMYLIGSITTPTASTRYAPSTFTDVGSTTTGSPTAAYDNDTTTQASVNANWGTTGVFPSFGTYTSSGDCTWGGFPSVTLGSSMTLSVTAATTHASSGVLVMQVIGKIASTPTTLLSTTATTTSTTYTMTIPSGTDISTVTIEGKSNISAGTPPGGGGGALYISEIYIS